MLSLLPNNVTYPCLSHFIGSNWEKWNLEKKDALWELLKAFSWSNQKVNRDFGAQDYKIEAFEVKDNDIPEWRPRNRKVNFRPRKSTGPTWSNPKTSHKNSYKTLPHPLGEFI